MTKSYNLVARDRGDSMKSPGPKVIKLFSCSTQLSIKFKLLINKKNRPVYRN